MFAKLINSRLNVVVRSPIPYGLGRNGCWPSRGSQLPRALPFVFSLCCPLNDRGRAAQSFFRIGCLFSLFCPSLARLRLLNFLLLLMSGNVHPNPGPIFSCSVCAGNVTWRDKSVQCCTCSKWVHLLQRPCVTEPEATFLSSTEPRALRSLTRPSALLSPPLNFLRLP